MISLQYDTCSNHKREKHHKVSDKLSLLKIMSSHNSWKSFVKQISNESGPATNHATQPLSDNLPHSHLIPQVEKVILRDIS